jgi:mycothiol synthase
VGEGEQLLDIVMRAPAAGDARQVADLVIACDVGAFGSADYTIEDLRGDWSQPGFVLETDALLVTTQAGAVIGYTAVHDYGQHARLASEGYVHPAHRGRGIGRALVRWAEGRARAMIGLAPAGAAVVLDQSMAGSDPAAAMLFGQEGYARVRTYWHMGIRMDVAPPPPSWPAGVAVRPFVLDQDAFAAYTVADEAFQDHWGHISIPFAEWHASRIERAEFDPSLTFLAWEGSEPAGAIRCRLRGEGGSAGGWVDNLSVRRPWRGRGLGTALLLHAFAAFHRRGTPTVALGVDAESLTGATRLYERAGMHVDRRFDVCRKTLREGSALS